MFFNKAILAVQNLGIYSLLLCMLIYKIKGKKDQGFELINLKTFRKAYTQILAQSIACHFLIS